MQEGKIDQGFAQLIEHQPSVHEDLDSIPSTA